MTDNRSSWFVSVPGIGFLLVLAVTAIYFRSSVIAVFLAAMTFLCMSSRLWSGRVLKRLEVGAHAVVRSAHVGESLRLDMRVRSRSLLPVIWMDVVLLTGARPVVRPEGEETDFYYTWKDGEKPQTAVRERLVWLWWQQEVSWEEKWIALRRGTVETGGVFLQAGDGFGMSAAKRQVRFSTPIRLLIYPEIVPVRVQPFLRVIQETTAGRRGQTEDITILKGSREYRPGDPMKRINWRLLAGSGKMEVNVYETITPGCVTFVPDLESFREIRVQKESDGTRKIRTFLMERELEEMISLIASCLRAIQERGLRTALVIPGYGNHEAAFCVPGDGENDPETGMNALAMIDYQAEIQTFPYERFWRMSHRMGNVYICTRKDVQTGLGSLAEGLGRSRAHFLARERTQAQTGEYDCLYADDLMLDRPKLDSVPKETLIETKIELGGK
ncbi:MAG: DUF58 domain-containing protein [Clostridiales bacterium]|nr:DUF58 domain-containing protein [Clostridiales bacterium]